MGSERLLWSSLIKMISNTKIKGDFELFIFIKWWKGEGQGHIFKRVSNLAMPSKTFWNGQTEWAISAKSLGLGWMLGMRDHGHGRRSGYWPNPVVDNLNQWFTHFSNSVYSFFFFKCVYVLVICCVGVFWGFIGQLGIGWNMDNNWKGILLVVQYSSNIYMIQGILKSQIMLWYLGPSLWTVWAPFSQVHDGQQW